MYSLLLKWCITSPLNIELSVVIDIVSSFNVSLSFVKWTFRHKLLTQTKEMLFLSRYVSGIIISISFLIHSSEGLVWYFLINFTLPLNAKRAQNYWLWCVSRITMEASRKHRGSLWGCGANIVSVPKIDCQFISLMLISRLGHEENKTGPSILFSIVLVGLTNYFLFYFAFCCCDEYSAQSKLGNQGHMWFIFLCLNSSLREVRAKTHGGNLEAKTDRRIMK